MSREKQANKNHILSPDDGMQSWNVPEDQIATQTPFCGFETEAQKGQLGCPAWCCQTQIVTEWGLVPDIPRGRCCEAFLTWHVISVPFYCE